MKFDGNGGTPSEPSREVMYGNTYGELPGASRTGYTFAGWFMVKTGGAKVEADANVTTGHTLYAHWKPKEYTLQ